MRTRSERRHNDWKKAIRKRNITRKYASPDHPWYNNLHQFSKNKIHCSCPMCRSKTNDQSVAGPAMNWPRRDAAQIVDMSQQMEEEYDNESDNS